ncbi:transposase [Escherichia coli]|nr:transposase [Escherichia coli]
MDTCFKILQLKFDQKLANRCIGLAGIDLYFATQTHYQYIDGAIKYLSGLTVDQIQQLLTD